ncbi:hypothetical protein N9832_05130 [Amylibacter sp.]|nr:hypothetical protein [Amylibacter sp.]
MKYKKLIMTTFTALTLVGSNFIGYADQLKPFDGIQFSKIDLNNYNLISKTELMNHREREFSFANTNHDGALSIEELITARTTKVSFRAKRMIQILDQNSNGVLEFDEPISVVSNRFGNIFESLDLNNDGPG